jgi:hypothetical protein
MADQVRLHRPLPVDAFERLYEVRVGIVKELLEFGGSGFQLPPVQAPRFISDALADVVQFFSSGHGGLPDG